MAISSIGSNFRTPAVTAKTQQNVAFTGLLEKAVSSKGFEKIAQFAAEKPAVFNSASSLALCALFRPATIMALPGKGDDAKKNKLTAAAHSISSGVMGFLITSLAMKPIKAGLDKVMKNADTYLPKLAEKMKENPATEAAVKKVLGFGPDIVLAIPRALLTSKMTSVIMNTFFKKDKKEPVKQEAPTQATQLADAKTDRPVLDNFKGGNK